MNVSRVSTQCVTEADLIERARQGDSTAFGELVERYQSSVFRTALAALRSREEAEDIAQDAFVAAWQKINDFRGDASFKTWLLAITWRRAVDRRKQVSEFLRRFSSGDATLPFDVADTGRSTEQALVDAERRRQVRRILRTLPPKFRDVLLLVSAGDLTFEQVADLLGIPVGTAKWRAAEGRRVLKKKLSRLGLGDE